MLLLGRMARGGGYHARGGPSVAEEIAVIEEVFVLLQGVIHHHHSAQRLRLTQQHLRLDFTLIKN
jgi:hypothetical protein